MRCKDAILLPRERPARFYAACHADHITRGYFLPPATNNLQGAETYTFLKCANFKCKIVLKYLVYL